MHEHDGEPFFEKWLSKEDELRKINSQDDFISRVNSWGLPICSEDDDPTSIEFKKLIDLASKMTVREYKELHDSVRHLGKVWLNLKED